MRKFLLMVKLGRQKNVRNGVLHVLHVRSSDILVAVAVGLAKAPH